MKTHNAQNERVKHTYFTYLREAKGMSEPSIDQTAKALSRFEAYTGHRDFKQFHRKQAEAFKQHLAGQRGQRTNEPLSKATIYSTLTTLKAFFVWLAGQPGYKVALQLRRRRVFQHDHEGRPDRQGRSRTSGTHAGADSARPPINAGR
jgi:site-specific recombinase XerC